MTPERLSELKKQVAALTYVPTRSAGLELIAEIEHLRETLTAVRDTIEHNPDSINEGAIVCTVWFSPIETMVDFIDAALNFHAVGEKE